MKKILNNKSTEPVLPGSYEGMCSRIAGILGQSAPSIASPKWDMSVVSRLCGILEYKRPDLLQQLKEEMALNIREEKKGLKILTSEIISGFNDTNTTNS